MGSRFPSHQLSNGLYVSGRPKQPKERTPAMSSVAMPYIGGDIKRSGELGKMFDIPVDDSKSRKSGPIVGSPSGAGTHYSRQIQHNVVSRVVYTSGTIPSAGMTTASAKKENSGPLNKYGEPTTKTSGPQSGGITPSGRQNSGPLPHILPKTGSVKLSNQAVTILGRDVQYSFRKNLPKATLWSLVLLFVMGFIAGGFILGAVHNVVLLIVVVILFSLVADSFTWNTYWGTRAIIGFISSFPDSELRTAKNGQLVKVSGVVTCGNVPLESSYQKVPRCVYTSTSLYGYLGWNFKIANSTHRRFTRGIRSQERHVVDFYISDFQSGLRALVKNRYGEKVIPYVDNSLVMNINAANEKLFPEFIKRMGERNLSSDDRTMQLEEGYIKEGNIVSVMGVVQRNDNVLMLVPPPEPIPTGCRWTSCFFLSRVEVIVLRCEDSSKNDVIPV